MPPARFSDPVQPIPSLRQNKPGSKRHRHRIIVGREESFHDKSRDGAVGAASRSWLLTRYGRWTINELRGRR
jgi:hypothetical protein